jgi:UDP-N-acetyl-D-mannosaminuronic acid dehydrogenase
LSRFDVCVVGGCGRVGLPLSIAFADKGMNVVLHDLDKGRLNMVKSGIMPFGEEGCEEKLKQVVDRTLSVADGPACMSEARFIIVTVGTPFERGETPDYSGMLKVFSYMLPYLVSGQYIILRSTVYPGTTERMQQFLTDKGVNVHVAFCPERLVEGKALAELHSLPQIVAAFDEDTANAAAALFRTLTEDIVLVTPGEAELAKLFANAWRYIQFSIANQFLMLADEHGLDYARIHHAMTYKYPRARTLPKPGLTGGPCLFKDTMQLAAFGNGRLSLGQAAALVNEGLPDYVVQKLKARCDLSSLTVGILGMAFKAESDDERGSLSLRLKALLEAEAKKVYCSDPFAKRDEYIGAQELVRTCQVIILAAPHPEYRHLHIGPDKLVVDIWDFYGRGLISEAAPWTDC